MENSKEYVKKIENQATEIWNKAPVELKDQFPELPNLIASIANTAYSILEAKPIIKIVQGLNPSVTLSQEDAALLLGTCKTNTTISANQEFLEKVLTGKALATQELCDKLYAAANMDANYLLVLGLLTGAYQLWSNFAAIYDICKAIEESEIEVKDSKVKIKDIKEDLNKIPSMIKAFSQILDELRNLTIDSNPWRILRLKNDADNEERKINKAIERILEKIDDVKVRVDNKTVQLKSARQAAISGAISGLVSSATGFANVMTLRSVANVALSNCSLTISLLNLCFSANLFWNYQSGTKVVSYLQEQLKAIKQLNELVKQHRTEISDLADEIYHVIDQLQSEKLN